MLNFKYRDIIITSFANKVSFYAKNTENTLDYVSGCDAVYEINFSKELYDTLKEFGQHLFEDTCTEEIAKTTWEALEKAVDFKKVKQTKSYVIEN